MEFKRVLFLFDSGFTFQIISNLPATEIVVCSEAGNEMKYEHTA